MGKIIPTAKTLLDKCFFSISSGFSMRINF